MNCLPQSISPVKTQFIFAYELGNYDGTREYPLAEPDYGWPCKVKNTPVRIEQSEEDL